METFDLIFDWKKDNHDQQCWPEKKSISYKLRWNKAKDNSEVNISVSLKSETIWNGLIFKWNYCSLEIFDNRSACNWYMYQ